MFHAPEKHRITKKNHPMLGSDSSYGNNGAFQVPLPDSIMAFVIASDGEGWEHVSIHVIDQGEPATPTWDEMCIIKGIFWDDEDCVVQYHPPKSEYVNNHKNTLHLWRPTNQTIPMPPSIMVGFKDNQPPVVAAADTIADTIETLSSLPGRERPKDVVLEAGSFPEEMRHDIENIVADIAQEYDLTDRVILYSDSEGNWDGWSKEKGFFHALTVALSIQFIYLLEISY